MDSRLGLNNTVKGKLPSIKNYMRFSFENCSYLSHFLQDSYLAWPFEIPTDEIKMFQKMLSIVKIRKEGFRIQVFETGFEKTGFLFSSWASCLLGFFLTAQKRMVQISDNKFARIKLRSKN
jgi:hypothetical protein